MYITTVLGGGGVDGPLDPFPCNWWSREGVLYPLCAIATLGSIPPLVQFQKVAEYRQIRDEKQNCFCGICLIGILGKDLGNLYIYVYIYVNKTVPKSSDSLRVIKKLSG